MARMSASCVALTARVVLRSKRVSSCVPASVCLSVHTGQWAGLVPGVQQGLGVVWHARLFLVNAPPQQQQRQQQMRSRGAGGSRWQQWCVEGKAAVCGCSSLAVPGCAVRPEENWRCVSMSEHVSRVHVCWLELPVVGNIILPLVVLVVFVASHTQHSMMKDCLGASHEWQRV